MRVLCIDNKARHPEHVYVHLLKVNEVYHTVFEGECISIKPGSNYSCEGYCLREFETHSEVMAFPIEYFLPLSDEELEIVEEKELELEF